MAARSTKLTVVKADGSREEYIYTKVVGTIANALCAAGQPDINVAEELAEAVTFFLYQTRSHRNVVSGEIFSIIQTVLADTGFENAAVALSEHHFERKLKRNRTEVTSHDTPETRGRWDKSRIVEGLVARHGLDKPIARTIASMVEEKVFNMGISLISTGLIKQLVLSDAAAVIRSQQLLQTT